MSRCLIVVLSLLLTGSLCVGGLARPPKTKAGTDAAASVRSMTNPKDGAQMVYVPAGTFTAGTSASEIAVLRKLCPNWLRDDLDMEVPPRQVYLPGYWIYKHEVTNGQFRKFCRSTGHKTSVGGKDDEPANNIKWKDASAYSRWAGCELPSEDQWEKAARSTDGRMYPWGNDWNSNNCWCGDGVSGLDHFLPVGYYLTDVSPYGCMDMGGSLMEWCNDSKAGGRLHALRGGDFYHADPQWRCRSARREYSSFGCGIWMGFRCVFQK